jgi:hypothetical protein
MARSKFVWLIVYETGETQFIKAQTVWQILTCNELIDSDLIINITKMELADKYNYKDAIDVLFQD